MQSRRSWVTCTSMQSLIEYSGPVEAEPPPNPQQPTDSDDISKLQAVLDRMASEPDSEPDDDDAYEMDTGVCVRCGMEICGACDVFGGFCLTCWQREGCPHPPNIPDAGRWPPGYLQRDPPATPTPADAMSGARERANKKFDGMPADMWAERRERANKNKDEMAAEAEERERARVRQKMLDHEREHAEERDRWGYLDNSESANVRRREQWGWKDNSESANVRRMHHFAEQFRWDTQRVATYERAREINALDLAPMRSLRAPPHRNQVPQFRLPPCAVAAEEDDPEDKAEEEEDESEDASEDDESIYWPDEAQTNLCQRHQCQVENDAMTDESVSATPMAASVPEEVAASMAATPPAATVPRQLRKGALTSMVPVYVPYQYNYDVNKRRKTTEEGCFQEDHSARSIEGSVVAETSATDGSYIMMPNWVGEINSDAPYVARGVSLQPHPGYTGPTPWYLVECDTGSTPP